MSKWSNHHSSQEIRQTTNTSEFISISPPRVEQKRKQHVKARRSIQFFGCLCSEIKIIESTKFFLSFFIFLIPSTPFLVQTGCTTSLTLLNMLYIIYLQKETKNRYSFIDGLVEPASNIISLLLFYIKWNFFFSYIFL